MKRLAVRAVEGLGGFLTDPFQLSALVVADELRERTIRYIPHPAALRSLTRDYETASEVIGALKPVAAALALGANVATATPHECLIRRSFHKIAITPGDSARTSAIHVPTFNGL